MENLPVVSKEKKLNFIQKIKLYRFRRNSGKIKFDIINKYEKASDYIKKDDIIVDDYLRRSCWEYSEILKSKNPDISEEEINKKIEEKILKVPGDMLVQTLKRGQVFWNFISVDNKLDLLEKEPQLLSNSYNDERKVIFLEAIREGKYNFINMYPECQDMIIEQLIEKGLLKQEFPNIINHVKYFEKYIIEKPELIKYLDTKKQEKLFFNNYEYLKYTSEEFQKEVIKKDSRFAKFVDDKIAEDFIKTNKENLSLTSIGFQFKILQKYLSAYKYISKEAKEELWSNHQSIDAAKTAISILQRDIHYSKEFSKYRFKAIADGSRLNNEYYNELINYLNNNNSDNIKKFIIHSKMFSSIGHMTDVYNMLHGGHGSEMVILGRECYGDNQKNIIKKLNLEQIKNVISIDNNYILPYLVIENGENKNESKEKCIQLFTGMYGTEKLKEIEKCIDTIYDKIDKQNPYNDPNYNSSNRYLSVISKEKIITDEFKILFNKNIIENNSIVEIENYFNKIKNGEDSKKEFYILMQKAYGEKALDILKSRPNLDVHTINSLEVFDSRIIDNFGEAFVHDLINYNILDFQEFLDVIKSDDKLETFKSYYNILTNVMGENVETMQRVISEYHYFDDLMQNIKDTNLTDKQYENLISVLCSKDNMFNINNIQQLEDFEEISKKYIQDEIKTNPQNIKKIICSEILGLRTENVAIRDYGDMLEDITDLYDIAIENKDNYSKEEYDMLECLYFIASEKDNEKLLELAENLLQERNIKNPVIMHKTVEKLKEHQTELFNDTLLTQEKMDELCEQEKDVETPKISRILTNDGLVEYILNGIDFKILTHNPGIEGELLPEEILKSEMQGGNPYICNRLVTEKNVHKASYASGTYVYTSIKNNGGIVAFLNEDAKTDHISKRTRGSGGDKKKITNDIGIEFRNEVAQYRRKRNHEDITNENIGGKFLPDFIIGPNTKDREFMKKYNIPILEINYDIYKQLAEEKQDDKCNKENDKKYEREF
ncbi:MAG: hypothetical protein ACLS95_06750 [Clostridia bacterium]